MVIPLPLQGEDVKSGGVGRIDRGCLAAPWHTVRESGHPRGATNPIATTCIALDSVPFGGATAADWTRGGAGGRRARSSTDRTKPAPGRPARLARLAGGAWYLAVVRPSRDTRRLGRRRQMPPYRSHRTTQGRTQMAARALWRATGTAEA